MEINKALDYAQRAARFKKDRGRLPDAASQDPFERVMALGAQAYMRYRAEGRYDRS